MQFVVTLLVIILACANYYGDVHWGPWFAVLFMASVAFAKWVTQRSHWSAGLCVFWSLFSGLFVFAFWKNHYWGNPSNIVVILHDLGAQAYAAMFACAFLVASLTKKQFAHVLDGFAFVGFFQGIIFLLVVESSYIWPFGLVHFPEVFKLEAGLQGLFGNTSMAACVSAMTLPLIFEREVFRWKWLRVMAVVLALCVVYVAQSSMGFLILMISVGAYFFAKTPIVTRKLQYAGLAILATIVLGQLFDYQFFQLSKIDRFKAWEVFFGYFKDQVPKVTGAGNGSFWFLGPVMQMGAKLPNDQGYWVWAHNDWLQLLYEQGVTGFLIGLNLLFCVLKYSFKNPVIFACAAAYAFLCFGMYPTNLAFTGVFGMVLVRAAFRP